MFRRTSARIAPGGSAEDDESDASGSNNTLLFSATAPARLASPDPTDFRSGGDIYADILATESRFGMGGNSLQQHQRLDNGSSLAAEEAASLAAETTRDWDLLVGGIAGCADNAETAAIDKYDGDRHSNAVETGGPLPPQKQPPAKGMSSLHQATDTAVLASTKAKVKGVSLGVMHVPGLLDAFKGKSASSLNRSESGAELVVRMRFPTAPSVRQQDADRLAAELSRGLVVHGAVPWVSIESTHDRGALRVVVLHPAYRNTLVGFVFTELDTALKAVGGTARGGLFLDAGERDRFLKCECGVTGHRERRTDKDEDRGEGSDWGPNGQKRPPSHLATVEAIKKSPTGGYPSFTLSDEIFGSDEVSCWRQKWEKVWTGDTGMDIQARLTRIDLYDGANPPIEPSSAETVVCCDVHSEWGVAIHEDDPYSADASGAVASGASLHRSEVREEGVRLCQRLLPTVPVPVPTRMHTGQRQPWSPPPTTSPSSSSSSSSSSDSSASSPRLAYLFELLNVIVGLTTVLSTAQSDLPHLVPAAALKHALENALPTQAQACKSEDGEACKWARCVTSTRIPFEPAVDRESGCVFLGGGVGLAAAPKGVLRRKRQRLVQSQTEGPTTSNEDCKGPASVDLQFELLTPESSRALALERARLRREKTVFEHQVCALGLWGNYASSHPSTPHPNKNKNGGGNEGGALLSASEVASAIERCLPDGYCRRTKKTAAQMAVDELRRVDAASLLLFSPSRPSSSTSSTSTVDSSKDPATVAVAAAAAAAAVTTMPPSPSGFKDADTSNGMGNGHNKNNNSSNSSSSSGSGSGSGSGSAVTKSTTATAAKKKQTKAGSVEYPGRQEERVVLFNGDEYAGGWRFGRRHGSGVYTFASGSSYQGEWKDGEMVGWGVYITEDGTRRNIRH